MTDNPSEDDKREDADAEFQRVLGNLVNMPHRPHKPPATDEAKTKRDTK